MVDTINYLDELIQQINFLKLAYGQYLTLKKTLKLLHKQKEKETDDDYAVRLMRELDESQNNLINQTVSNLSNCATFVVMEVESLKKDLPEKDVLDLNESYKDIELNARPTIEQAKKFVQAANNLKVSLTGVRNVLEMQEKVKNLGQNANH